MDFIIELEKIYYICYNGIGKGQRALPYVILGFTQKGDSAMKAKFNVVLDEIDRVAKAVKIVVSAARDLLNLF